MVVAQHVLKPTGVDLGFMGVSLFFALSGYLITSLLLDELDARGSVSLGNFYLRRGARLLPALFLMIAVCNLLFLAFGDFHPIRGSVYALTYSANYAQVIAPHSMPGFGPTWTLAVEEHFYIAWPLVLLFVVRRCGIRTALRATLGACFLALVWRLVLALGHVRISLLEIGSLERSDALLYGCAAALALRIGWRPRPWMFAMGVIGTAAIPVAFHTESYHAAILGQGAMAVATAAVVVGLDYRAGQRFRAVLSARPIVTVGVFSYGIYLWHGPVIRVAGDAALDGGWWRATAALGAIGAAAVSYRFVEHPIRRWARTVRPREAPPATNPALARGQS